MVLKMEEEQEMSLTPEALPIDLELDSAVLVSTDEDLDCIRKRYLPGEGRHKERDSDFYGFTDFLPERRKPLRKIFRLCSMVFTRAKYRGRTLQDFVRLVLDLVLGSVQRPLSIFSLAGCCVRNAGFNDKTFPYFFNVVLQLRELPHFDDLYQDGLEVLAAHRIKVSERCYCVFKPYRTSTPPNYLDVLFALLLRLKVFGENLRHKISRQNFLVTVRNTMFTDSEETPELEVSTGREVVEIVDGVSFITFQSERDMNEFTSLAEEYVAKNYCDRRTRRRRKMLVKSREITNVKSGTSRLFLREKHRCEKTLRMRKRYARAYNFLKRLEKLKTDSDVPLASFYNCTPCYNVFDPPLEINLERIEEFMKTSSLAKRQRKLKKSTKIRNVVEQKRRCSSSRVPLVVSCSGGDHEVCLSKQIQTFKLAAVLHIGPGRPLDERMRHNLELLKKDEQLIDERWASVAASALRTQTVKRILVPVVSEELIELAEYNLRKPLIERMEVETIVRDLVDYVAKREEFESHQYPLDDSFTVSKNPTRKQEKTKAERELSRLVNVRILDESNRVCGKDFCALGCVCRSLESTALTYHCKRTCCIFGCKCPNREELERDATLAREEATWRQTIIRRNNDVLEISGDKWKSKREKKLPTRYRNNVFLGREMSAINTSAFVFDWCTDNADRVFSKSDSPKKKTEDTFKEKPLASSSPKIPQSKRKRKPTQRIVESIEQNSAENNSLRRRSKKKTEEADISVQEVLKQREQILKSSEDLIEKILKRRGLNSSNSESSSRNISSSDDSRQEELLSEDLIEEVTVDEEEEVALRLADVYVWCSVHGRYTCPCPTHLYFLKTSSVIYSPSPSRLSVLLTEMGRHLEDPSNVSTLHMYDRQTHSARTFGSLIDYSKRNSSNVFRSKRKLEREHSVLSCTNSFVKVQLPARTKVKLEPAVDQNLVIDENRTKSAIPKKKKKKILISPVLFENIKTKKVNFDLSTNKNSEKSKKVDCEPSERKRKYCIGPAFFDANSATRIKTPSQQEVPRKKFRVEQQSFRPPQTSLSSIIDRKLPQAPPNAAQTSRAEYGFLCVTRGFGYFRLEEYSPERLKIKDPLSDIHLHTFSSPEAASKWLNVFFKSRMLFEDKDHNLTFMIVTGNLLKNYQPFDKSILETKMINKQGCLVDKFPKSGVITDLKNKLEILCPSPNAAIVVQSTDKASTSSGVEKAVGQPSRPIPLPTKININDSSDNHQNSPKFCQVEKSWSLSEKSESQTEMATIKPVFLLKNGVESTGRGSTSQSPMVFRIPSQTSSSLSEGRFIPLKYDSSRIILQKRSGAIIKRIAASSQSSK